MTSTIKWIDFEVKPDDKGSNFKSHKNIIKGDIKMNLKGLNKKLRKMNLYEIHQKILNGKKVSWMENALYAGFSPEEIVEMVEANLE